MPSIDGQFRSYSPKWDRQALHVFTGVSPHMRSDGILGVFVLRFLRALEPQVHNSDPGIKRSTPLIYRKNVQNTPGADKPREGRER